MLEPIGYFFMLILIYVSRDDSGVMEEDLSFGEIYETSAGLQMQI